MSRAQRAAFLEERQREIALFAAQEAELQRREEEEAERKRQEEEEARQREEERRRAEQVERERREREEAARRKAEKQRREAEARRRAEETTEDTEDEDMGVESEIGGTSQVAKGKRWATAERQKKRKRVSDTGLASKKRADTESGSVSGNKVNAPYVMVLLVPCRSADFASVHVPGVQPTSSGACRRPLQPERRVVRVWLPRLHVLLPVGLSGDLSPKQILSRSGGSLRRRWGVSSGGSGEPSRGILGS